MSELFGFLRRFLQELKRRTVYNVAVTCADDLALLASLHTAGVQGRGPLADGSGARLGGPTMHNWSVVSSVVACVLSLPLGGCQSGGDDPQSQTSNAGPVTVEVTAVDYAFQAPDSIPSGWVTFRMTNRGRETHYFLLERLPKGRTFEDYRKEILPAMDTVQRALAAGPADSAKAIARVVRTEFPGWSARSIPPLPHAGGVGLTGPGETGQTTLRVEPGRYVLSCFLTTPEGQFHGLRGMIRPVTVREASSGASPPRHDVEITSSGREVTIEGSFTSGEQTVAIQVEEPPDTWGSPYEFHLARLGPDVEANEVAAWNETLFRNPAPATFLGGAEGIPAGETAYVTVDLEPGRYGWFAYHQEETLIEEFRVE